MKSTDAGALAERGGFPPLSTADAPTTPLLFGAHSSRSANPAAAQRARHRSIQGPLPSPNSIEFAPEPKSHVRAGDSEAGAAGTADAGSDVRRASNNMAGNYPRKFFT